MQDGEMQYALAQLETGTRALRRTVRGIVLVIAAMIIVFLYVLLSPRTIKARSFVLVDANGRPRAVLGMIKGNNLNPDPYPALTVIHGAAGEKQTMESSRSYFTADGVYVTPGPIDDYDMDILRMADTPGTLVLSSWRGMLINPISGSGTAGIPVMSDERFYLTLTTKEGARIVLEPGKTNTWADAIGHVNK